MAKPEVNSKIEELKKRMKKNVAKLVDVKKSNTEDESAAGYTSNGEYLDFEDGKTIKLRFFPSHNEGEKFFVLRKRYWLPVEKDNGEMGRTTINDSIRHGGTKLDIVNEYRTLGNKIHKDNDKYLKLLNDSYGGGCAPTIDWVAYALKVATDDRKFGMIAFKKTVRDEINKINFIEEDDEPLEAIDTFTGEGYPLLVKYLSKPNKKKGEDYYACQKGKKPVELEDEEILAWGDAKPLSEIYSHVYGLKDFEKALECLRLFDEEHGMDIFEDDRWEDIIENVKAQYEDSDDEDDEEDEKPKKKSSKKPEVKKSSKKVVEEDEEEDDDDDEEEEEEKPKKKSEAKKPTKKVVEEDDDEDEDEDDEEDEPAPKKVAPKKPAKKVVEEDEDDDEEDEEEKPKKKSPTIQEIRDRLKNKKK